MTAERISAKLTRHRSQPMMAEYGKDHLLDRREAILLYVTSAEGLKPPDAENTSGVNVDISTYQTR